MSLRCCIYCLISVGLSVLVLVWVYFLVMIVRVVLMSFCLFLLSTSRFVVFLVLWERVDFFASYRRSIVGVVPRRRIFW